MRKITNWVINKLMSVLDVAVKSSSKFINRQTWVISIFALIGAGYVLSVSIPVIVNPVREEINYKLKQIYGETITVYNVNASSGNEGENKLTDITDLPEVERVEPLDERGGQGKDVNSVQEMESKIKEVFGDQGDIAVAVARAESSMNPLAVGDKHLSKPSYGLFQVSRIYHDHSEEDLLNADYNIKVAKEIYDRGGWSRWTTYREGSYLKYL